MGATAKTAQVRLSRSSPGYWRVTFDNPPLNVMGPEFVLEFRKIMTTIESDEQVKVVVFDSAVEGFFLNHSDFLAKLEELTGIPQGPTGLEAWPDILVRLTHAPIVSIASLRGPASQRRRHRWCPREPLSPCRPETPLPAPISTSRRYRKR